MNSIPYIYYHTFILTCIIRVNSHFDHVDCKSFLLLLYLNYCWTRPEYQMPVDQIWYDSLLTSESKDIFIACSEILCICVFVLFLRNRDTRSLYLPCFCSMQSFLRNTLWTRRIRTKRKNIVLASSSVYASGSFAVSPIIYHITQTIRVCLLMSPLATSLPAPTLLSALYMPHPPFHSFFLSQSLFFPCPSSLAL